MLEARIVGPCEAPVTVLAIVTIAVATMTVAICAVAAGSGKRSQKGFHTRDSSIVSCRDTCLYPVKSLPVVTLKVCSIMVTIIFGVTY